MALYLLHFDPPYPGGRNPQHYLGWTTDGNIENRVLQHLNNGHHASPLVVAAVEIGCDVRLARTWPKGNRALEAELKRSKKSYASMCPICNGERGELYEGEHQQAAGQPAG